MFKTLRNIKGFKQEQLASRLNVKQSTISNWENGVSKPDITMVAKIADVFKCDVADVVKCFLQEEK